MRAILRMFSLRPDGGTPSHFAYPRLLSLILTTVRLPMLILLVSTLALRSTGAAHDAALT